MANNNTKTPASAQFAAHDRMLPFLGEEAVDTAVLECFDYAYADKGVRQHMEILSETEEFTSVCPFSGLPDFAKISIVYAPDRKCIELRSLKYYLMSYRQVGIWYEHLVNRMLDDLVAISAPLSMRVTIQCTPRGGIASTVTASYERLPASPPTA